MIACTIIVTEDDGSYVSDLRELPGCMSQGNTVADAVENLAGALRTVLEVMREDGQVPPWEFSARGGEEMKDG